MKKLFSLLTLALLTMSAWAQTSVTLDFQTNDDWGFPTAYTVDEGTFSNGTYSVTIAGSAGNGYKFGGSYLIFGKQGAYLTLPAFDQAVKKIIVTGKSGASTAVKQNIFVGDNAVSTETTGATGENTYVIADDYQTVGTIYTLKVTSAHNTQVTKIEVCFEDNDPIGPSGENLYEKVTSASQLVAGQQYILVYEAATPAFMGAISTTSTKYGLSITGPTITDGVANIYGYDVVELTLGGETGAWTFDMGNSAYLYWNSGNSLNTNSDATLAGAQWTVTEKDGSGFILTNVGDNTRILQYNDGSPRFACYTGAQKDAVLYVKTGGVTPPDPQVTEVATLLAANALADNAAFKFTGDAVVTYHNGKYMFLRDANNGYGLIYEWSGDSLANGTVLNKNWTATKTTYKSLVEYTGAENVSASGITNSTLAAVQEIDALSNDMINAYVKINNVKSIVKVNNNYKAVLANGDSIALFNRFNKTITEFTDANCSITGIVSIYNDDLQLYFIEDDYVAPQPIITEVANIAAANQNVTAGNQFTFTGNVVVAYKHGNQLWLRDASGSAYAYNATDSTIAQGTVIAPNWGATMATYNNKPEYTNLTNFVASGTQEVLPYERQTLTLEDNYAEYVIVKGLKFVSTSTSGGHVNYVTEDGLTVRDNFDILKNHYDENATYNITGVVTAYSGAVQLYITDYEAIVGVAMPVIEPNGGTFVNEVEVTITCATDGADIYYTINDGDEILYQGPFTLTETATVKAYADLDGTESSMATATFTKVEDVTYTLVTDGAQLADGDKIILVSTAEAGDAYAMGAAGSNNFGHAAVTITEDKTITTHEANVITLGKVDDNWTLLANEGYLYAASSTKNWLKAEAEVDDNAIAQIVVSDSAAVFIQFQGANSRNILRYNPNESNNNPLFSCYNAESSIQNPVYIFKAGAVEPQGLRGDVDNNQEVGIADVSALIDYLLSGDASAINLQNANCNLDEEVGIADVSALIDYLLSGTWND